MEDLAESSTTLLDSENSKQKIVFQSSKGPYYIEGSDQFICIYNQQDNDDVNNLNYKMIVYHRPDSTKRMMIQDHYKRVEMSTFLDEEIIMIQVD